MISKGSVGAAVTIAASCWQVRSVDGKGKVGSMCGAGSWPLSLAESSWALEPLPVALVCKICVFKNYYKIVDIYNL